jgi:hypothetical protein
MTRKWEYGVSCQMHNAPRWVFHGEEPFTKAEAKAHMQAPGDRLVRRRINPWKRVK